MNYSTATITPIVKIMRDINNALNGIAIGKDKDYVVGCLNSAGTFIADAVKEVTADNGASTPAPSSEEDPTDTRSPRQKITDAINAIRSQFHDFNPETMLDYYKIGGMKAAFRYLVNDIAGFDGVQVGFNDTNNPFVNNLTFVPNGTVPTFMKEHGNEIITVVRDLLEGCGLRVVDANVNEDTKFSFTINIGLPSHLASAFDVIIIK